MSRFFALYATMLFCVALPTACRHKPLVEKGDNIAVKVYALNGNIVFTRAYCGGIRPSEETLAEGKKTQPYANHTLFVKQSEGTAWAKTVFHSFATDKRGNFQLELPEGNYGIFTESKTVAYDNKYAQGGGKEFCDKWRATPDMLWKIAKNAQNQSFKLHIPCNPCREPAR